MQYTYITDFKNNDKQRKAFNTLCKEIFCFDFEVWYQSGFWGNQYIPHALMDGDIAIANVSANIMDFEINGMRKRYIQIGTVMTHPDYRNKGLGRWLMDKVLDTYKDKVDGFYLFGNDSVLDYYPKFGFKKSKEYTYSSKISSNAQGDFKPVVSSDAEREKYIKYIQDAKANDGFFMHNLGLMSFWTSNLEDLYYSKDLDTYVHAEIDNQCLELNSIISPNAVDLNDVINAFGYCTDNVELNFTPLNKRDFTVKEYHEDDCTLFYLGDDLKIVEDEQLHFPVFSHA